MPTRAWLVDVYRTTLDVDFDPAWERIGAAAGVSPAALRAAASVHVPEVMIGRRTFRNALGDALASCGARVADHVLDELMAIDRQAIVECSTIHEDAVGLLRRARAAGDAVAFLSNCDDNTRYFLTELGLTSMVDAMVLSHEVGVAKPDAEIYERALTAVGVEADRATFVDDDLVYCRGAVDVGIRAICVARRPQEAPGVDEGIDVVASLDDIVVDGA